MLLKNKNPSPVFVNAAKEIVKDSKGKISLTQDQKIFVETFERLEKDSSHKKVRGVWYSTSSGHSRRPETSSDFTKYGSYWI